MMLMLKKNAESGLGNGFVNGAKQVDPAKAMGNFTRWTYAAVNAIASEVAKIRMRLYQVSGQDHEEQDLDRRLDPASARVRLVMRRCLLGLWDEP